MLDRCRNALKDFRPDIDFSPIAASESNVKVVKKNFTDDSVKHLQILDINKSGFDAIRTALMDFGHYLEGGISIDVSSVKDSNMIEAFENVSHYESKLAELKKTVRNLDNVVSGALIKFEEQKNNHKFSEDKFKVSVLKKSKESVAPLIRQIDSIQTDLNGAKVLLEDKKNQKPVKEKVA